MILPSLGVFGWKEADENLALASLLTGDPLVLISDHGCAKTHVATKLGQALGCKCVAYDASKCMFEDVLGYPNVEKLKSGVVEYVPSPVTVWDKDFILIDEINRAEFSMQSKWLELVRSRKIMGFPTQVKWVWAAMNPVSYAGTQALDNALIGRFALFLYPPTALQMNEEDRIRVLTHMNGQDAPSLSEWVSGVPVGTVPESDVIDAGDKIRQILNVAGCCFLRLRDQLPTMAEFLAKFADLLLRETKGEVSLDGRRLGFIYRNLLANRSIELAKADIMGAALPDFVASARYTLQSSIPIGINQEGIQREQGLHAMEICFDLLSPYFNEGEEISRVNQIYELFTTGNPMRKAELLLSANVGDFAVSKAWTDLMAEDRDITLLAYVALQIDSRRPGTVPQELLASLCSKVSPDMLSSSCVPMLKNDAIEHVEEVERLLDQDSDLEKLVAYQRVKQLIESGNVIPKTIHETGIAIQEDIAAFRRLLDGVGPSVEKGRAA